MKNQISTNKTLKIPVIVRLRAGVVYAGENSWAVFLWDIAMTINLDNLTEQDIKNMTSDELNKAIEEILKSTERDLKLLMAMVRYQNIGGRNSWTGAWAIEFSNKKAPE